METYTFTGWILFHLNYTENEQQRESSVQYLTAEVLGSIWTGLSKEASEWEFFYFAIKQFPKVMKAISIIASSKYNKKFIQIYFFISYLLLSPVYAISLQGLIFFSPPNKTELLPGIEKLIALANSKTCYFWWSILQDCPPFMFFYCQIQDSISCYQIQKDDLHDFFYCVVSSKMHTWLPNCDPSDKIIFSSLGTAQILDIYSPFT